MVTLKNPKVKSFIQVVKDKCIEHNIELQLVNRKKIKIFPKIYVGGYFEDTSRKSGVLACALDSKEYLNILVHEFSHVEQWIENTPVWKDSVYVYDVDQWLNGKEVRNIEDKIDKVKYMELDCEKRSVKNIIKYDLPLDISTYIKKANSYIFFYEYLKQTRRWCKPNNAPFNNKNKNLWKLCSGKIENKSYYKEIPPRILKKFIENEI